MEITQKPVKCKKCTLQNYMAYPYTKQLDFPLTDYKVNSYKFGERCTYDKVYWGVHLGEDINVKSGTKVRVIGRGKVVYAKLHAGTKKKPNWGNIVIIAHKNPKTKKPFFSLYAHLGETYVKKDDKVELGQKIGLVGKPNTSENGWWSDAHLHFAIYTGKWSQKVLPGYYKTSQKRTKLSDWQNPKKFIRHHN